MGLINRYFYLPLSLRIAFVLSLLIVLFGIGLAILSWLLFPKSVDLVLVFIEFFAILISCLSLIGILYKFSISKLGLYISVLYFHIYFAAQMSLLPVSFNFMITIYILAFISLAVFFTSMLSMDSTQWFINTRLKTEKTQLKNLPYYSREILLQNKPWQVQVLQKIGFFVFITGLTLLVLVNSGVVLLSAVEPLTFIINVELLIWTICAFVTWQVFKKAIFPRFFGLVVLIYALHFFLFICFVVAVHNIPIKIIVNHQAVQHDPLRSQNAILAYYFSIILLMIVNVIYFSTRKWLRLVRAHYSKKQRF